MLTHLIEEWARGVARKVGQVVSKSGLSPNMLTVIGFLLNFPAAIVLGLGGNWFWGGVLVLVAGSFDMLDGAVAKVTNKTSTFGAFLDSTLDRCGEAVVFGGLLYYYQSSPANGQHGEALLVYVSVVGSLMVSYTKARAEGLNIQSKGVGLLPRPDRVLLVAFGAILTTWVDWAMLVALWILAVGTTYTTIQRITHTWMEAKRQITIPTPSTTAINTPATTVTKTVKEPVPVLKASEIKEEEDLTRRERLFRRVSGR